MTAPVVTLGLVGCGRLAEYGYLPALERAPALRLVGVADPDADRRTLVARRARDLGRGDVVAAASAEELMASTELDAVIVASPPACHVPDATTVSAAGVRAVVEKPPAPDLVTARALRDLRPEPWIGFNRRFDPGLGRMRADLPDSGWLELRLELRYRRSGWQPVAVRDDALADLGTHVADLAGWLGGGRPVAVEGAAATSTTASFEIELERGRARVRLAADRPHRERYEVRDRHGTTLARHRLGGPVQGVLGLARRRRPSALVESLAGQLTAVAAALVGAPTALGTVADGLTAMAIVEAAGASAAAGGGRITVVEVQA
jgi:myo-inositol 2-dehydrogenase/D-chiro-inositol 1-dehydrogenase